MASPARARSPRINLAPPPEVLTLEDHYDRLRLAARSSAIRAIELIDLVWRREPTMFIELGVAWTILVWSMTLLMFGTGGYPPLIAGNLTRGPELLLSLTGLLVVMSMAVSLGTRHRHGRGYASFAAACWLGYLSFSILAGDPRLAGGYVYLGTAVAALLPFWRVVLDRRI